MQCLKLAIVPTEIILPLLDDVNLVNDCHDLLPLESLRSKQLLEVIISEETFGDA